MVWQFDFVLGWNPWGPWGSCQGFCGSNGERVRIRTCQTGTFCRGPSSDSIPCSPPCSGGQSLYIKQYAFQG